MKKSNGVGRSVLQMGGHFGGYLVGRTLMGLVIGIEAIGRAVRRDRR